MGVDVNYRMPAEWEPHRATWISWPHHEPDWPGKLGPIPWVYAEIARVLKITDGVMRHLAVTRVKGGQIKAPAPIAAVSVPADDSDPGAE